MRTAVEHSRRLAAFVAGCATGDADLIRAGLEDILVEPQRAHLLPALAPVKAAALAQARSAAPSRARVPRSSPGRWRATRMRWRRRWTRRSARRGWRRPAYRAPVDSARRPAGACMRFVSTRGQAPAVGPSEAIRAGAAPDGGPLSARARSRPCDRTRACRWPTSPQQMLAPFFADDPLAAALPAICAEAFDFPVPIVTPDPARPALQALELFHGPTGAFKDFGARFLAACFARLGEAAAPSLWRRRATRAARSGPRSRDGRCSAP